MTQNIIYTPSNIFADANLTLNSEATVIKETDISGVKLKEIYFSGREVNGKRPRGYGILATSKPDAPLIVIIGDYNHEVCEEYVLSYASRGFSVFMFDYAGEYGSKTKYTFYPQEIDYANFSRAERHLNYADIDVRQTSYFEWVLQSYYAISACFSLLNGYTFKTGLIGIGCGADIVWMLSSFDKRISAYCTVFSAGWDAYKEIYKYSDENTLKDISDERERWLAGISSESYAKFVNAPMLYVSSSNSAKTDMDRAYDTVSRISKDIDTFMCISARLSDYINYYNKQNILLFFKKYLQDENIILPPKANTVIKNIDDTIAVTVEEAVVQDIKKVTVFC